MRPKKSSKPRLSFAPRWARASPLTAILTAGLQSMFFVVVTGCHDRRWSGFFHRGPYLKWELAPNGLPSDGMWKSTPVLADIKGDGFLDLAAIARLGNGAH